MVHFRKLNGSFTTAPEPPSDEELALEPRILHNALTPGSTVADPEEDEGTHASDTNCISTIFRFATGSEAFVAVAGFIPEIDWTLKVQRVPLVEVCHSLRRSFELLDGTARIRPGMRGQAYDSAIALLCIRVQRLCVDATDNAHIVATSLQPLLFGYQSKKDHDLVSTFRVLDVVFNGDKDIPWGEFKFSESHYCWLSYIIRCRAWNSLRTRESLTKDISEFILHSFSKEPPPRVIADCLLVVKMIVGGVPKFNNKMLIKDRRLVNHCDPSLALTKLSAEIEETLRQIYRSIESALTLDSSALERQRAVEALKFLAPLKQEMLCVESYKVFRTVMANVTEPDSWLWRPAELLMVGAFKWQMEPLFIGDPAELVNFLRHCLSEQGRGHNRDEPIERIMLALAGATVDKLGDGLTRIDFTEPLLLNGIRDALREEAPYRLRRATVTFLRHLDAQLFDTNRIFSEEQATTLVSRWSISAKESWGKGLNPLLAEALVTTLMGLLDSPFWREYIPRERWDILQIIGAIGGNLPRSLHRCFKNLTIIPHLREMDRDDSGSGVFTQWVAIMWMKYPDLSEEVKIQLMKVTKEIAGWPENDISAYLTLLEGEIKRDEGRIGAHSSWSFEEDAVRSRTRHKTLLSARRILTGIRDSPFR